MAIATNIILDVALDIAPSLGSMDAAKLCRLIELHKSRVSVAAFGNNEAKATLATGYLIAHQATLVLRAEEGETAAGAIVSEKEGDLERRYANISSSDDSDAAFKTTPFGLQFLQLRNECVSGGITRCQ